MTLLLSPEVSSQPNLLSGRAISEHLLQSGKIPVDADQGSIPDMENTEKEARNERLRAERFGIQAAIIDRFTESIVSEDTETGRPVLNIPIGPRPVERRAWNVKAGYMMDGPEGLGIYQYWQPYSAPEERFNDFQADFEAGLEAYLEEWGESMLTSNPDPEITSWANRLVVVGQEQRELDVAEAVLSDRGDTPFKAGEFAGDTPVAIIGDLPVANIPDICGEMAEVTLGCLDNMGIADEDERLRALDDIMLQARDISQHHIAHFTNGESDEVDSAPKLKELGAELYQDDDGRWHLEWEGRVKKKPKEKILSRTQHCPAAYRFEGQPSAIERLGWAFNTELQKRGFLKPGATKEPAQPFAFPPPVKVSDDPWGTF